MDLIDKIELAKKTVLERYDFLHSKYTQEMFQINTQLIKDQIFSDQYCTVFDVYKKYPLFNLKLDLLLFSEYDDHLIDGLK